MTFFKHILTSFLAVVICISLCFTSVFAAWYNDLAYKYTQSDLAQWCLELLLVGGGGALGGAIGGAAGTVVIPGVGTVEGAVIGKYVGAGTGVIGNQAVNSFMEYLAQDSSFVSEQEFVSSLDSPVIDSGSIGTYYPTDWTFTKIGSENWQDVSLTSGKGSLSFYGLNTKGTWSTGGSSPTSWFTSGLLTLPRGTYRLYADSASRQVWSAGSPPPSSSESVSVVYLAWNNGDYYFPRHDSLEIGDYIEFVVDSEMQDGRVCVGAYGSSVSENFIYTFDIAVHIECIYRYGGDFNPGSGAGRPGSETRAGAFMKAISGYNSVTNQYNFFIGTTDSSGKVNNVYDPAIFDEASMIFTEPVTGQQYQCTGWKYGYASAARGYRLDLAEDTYSYNGKDIRTLCLFYLDDALYIVGLDQVYSDYYNDNSSVNDFFSNAVFIDKYSYVVAEATGESAGTCQHVYTSETITSPTCVEQGVRRYTCTLCGHTRDEKIPATGHAWEVTESVETEVNENGDVTKLGYKVYTCSVCGETYKQYDNTGQPGPPSGGGSAEDEGWFSWLGNLFKKLISAIVDGLASGLEYLVDKVIVTVTDLVMQTIQWVFSSLHISDLTTWFTWFDDGNPLFHDEFGQDSEEVEVDVWAYS